MKPKDLRRHLKRRRIRPSKAAYRVMKGAPGSWRDNPYLQTFQLRGGITAVLTRPEVENLKRRELSRRAAEYFEQARAARRREVVVASVISLTLCLPAGILVLGTTVATYWNLLT